VPEKTAKPARRRTTTPRTRTARRARGRKIGHAEIAQRAYYIYLDEGRSDELENWLRAERELTAA
jgi:hypothetical protein